MKLHSLILATVFSFLLSFSLAAEPGKTFGREPHKLIYNNILYQFKFIPVLDKQGELMWYEGEMSGTRHDGSLVFSKRTDLQPNCDMNFPAISLIDIPLMDGSNPQTYILFCEASGGTSNFHRLRFYRYDKGFVGTFEANSTPQIEQSGKIPELIAYKIFYRKRGGRLSWPVFYDITAKKSGEVDLFEKDIASNKSKYQKILKAPYYNLTAKKEGIGDNLIANKLIILAIIGEAPSYCRLAKEIQDKDFLDEVEIIISSMPLPIIQCKE